MKTKIVGLLFILGILTVVPATAQSGGPWLLVESDNFTFFSNNSRATTQTVAYNLEEMRRVFAAMWSQTSVDSSVPTRIYLFRDEESFVPFRLRGVETAGYVVPHEHGYYAGTLVDAERPARYIYKEYILQLLHDNYVGLPLWLRHGLAQYYGTFEVEGQDALIGKVSLEYRALLTNYLGPNANFALDQVLTADEMPESPQTFFALSWAMTHYLMWRSEDLREKLRTYVREVTNGTPANEALRTIFAFDYKALEADLKEYLRRTEYNYQRVTFSPGAHPLRVRELTAYETNHHLGDLVIHAIPKRAATAGVHLLQRALEIAPDHAPSWAALGYASELQDNDPVALTQYAKAVELDPDDYLSQYLYGESLLRTLGGQRPTTGEGEEQLAKAVAALEKSVQLRPEMAQAWARLGFAFVLSPEASPRAVEVLEKALAQLPTRADVAMNLLLAYARAGDREGANAMIRRMERLKVDPASLGRAQEVRLQMDYHDAQRYYRQGNYDDAIALFTRIQAESQNPALKQAVDAALEDIAPVVDFKRFSELYNEAVVLLKTNDFEKTDAVLQELEGLAKAGMQEKAIATLREIFDRKKASRRPHGLR